MDQQMELLDSLFRIVAVDAWCTSAYLMLHYSFPFRWWLAAPETTE
jgi:hypothetical protein